jgi:hypothetical protein
VNSNVSPLLTGTIGAEFDDRPLSWTSDGNYAVVLLRSRSGYWLYVNVTMGSVLTMGGESNTSDMDPRIKAVSRFFCAAD